MGFIRDGFLSKETIKIIESLHNIDFDCYTSAQYQGIIYFDSWELCKKTIEEAGEDNIKKYLFEVMDNE